MTAARRRDRRSGPRAAALAVAALFALAGRPAAAADSPVGKVIADIVPMNNRVHPREHVLGVMHSRPGKPYDEGMIQEDVRRLHATKWFVPGGVQVSVKPDSDGRVLVFVSVSEVTSTVSEVVFMGAQHMNVSDLIALAGVRRGDPMNPLANEMGRQAIARKYQEDGRYFATVELVEGSKPTDTRVAYRVVEGPVVRIGGVEFKGNEHATTGRLKTQLTASKAFLGVIGGKFNPMVLDVDRQRLTEYYHALGHLRARVDPEVRPSDDLRTVTIVYHVAEGPLYSVANRQVDGNKTFTADRLDPLAELRPGDKYDRRKTVGDAERIKNFYGYRGHLVAVDEVVTEVADRPGVVNVSYQIHGDRGERDRIGLIKVQGNEVTQERVVLNQLNDIGIRPGQVLQYPNLEVARMRLARLGIFDPENPPLVFAEPPDPLNPDSPFKNVVVQVQETRTGQFMIGAGVNSNSGINGNFVINERNFDIFRFPTSWDDIRYGRAFRGAGQELRLEAVPGTIFQRYSATFREPYLFDSPYGLTTSAYFFNRSYAEYTEDRYGGRITIDRRLDPIWSASASARVEGVDVGDVPDYAPESIRRDVGQSFVLGLGGGVKRDTRDSFIYPTTGSVLDVSAEQVLGSYTFPTATAEFTKFFSTRFLQREDGSGRHVLAFRSQLSVEGANAPVFERFYAGGFRSLRGWSFRGVGPNENTLFTGGTFSFLNTVEYQIPLLANDKFHFVTFLDHGTVESDISIRDYRVSAGFGFRIAIPALGPLPVAIDFAFPLNQRDTDNKQLVNFYVGVFGGNGRQ